MQGALLEGLRMSDRGQQTRIFQRQRKPAEEVKGIHRGSVFIQDLIGV